MSDLISIIIPVFNVKEYLEECLHSVISQTYENLQIIVIDDGSTDGSREICDRFCCCDERVLVIHKKNGGLVSARKEGLKYVKGKYVGFVDADDYILPDMYKDLLEIIHKEKADFVHSGYWEIDIEGGTSREVRINSRIVEIDDESKRKKEITDLFLNPRSENFLTYSIWSKLYTAEFICDCYSEIPDYQQYGEDMIALFMMLIKTRRMIIDDRCNYMHRIRTGTLSHFHDSISIVEEFKLCESINMLHRKHENVINNNEYWLFIEKKLKNAFERKLSNVYRIPEYYYKKVDLIRSKKICLYGAGRVAEDYYLQLKKNKIDIVFVADRQGNECDFIYTDTVLFPYEIQPSKVDYILIAVWNEYTAAEIKQQLMENGISEKCILWEKPELYFSIK